MIRTAVALREICSPKQHKTIPTSLLLAEGYPVFGANGQIGFYSEYTHSEETIAITCRGATCGTINVVPAMSYITGNAMALDKLDTKRVDLRFLVYALRHRGMHDVISGSAQPQITRAPLLDVTIPLPPLDEQKRIAAILDQADELRRKRQRAIDCLNQLGQAIFHEMFGATSRHQAEGDAGITWGDVALGDICSPKQHKTIPTSALLPKGYPVFGANGQIGFYSEYTHSNETVAITCRGATCGTINVAPAMSYITGNAMALDNLDQGRVDLRFLVYALRNRGLHDVISGSAQPQITRAPLLDLKIPLPPLAEQKRFAKMIAAIDLQIELSKVAKSHIDALFSSLQHRAFQGEL